MLSGKLSAECYDVLQILSFTKDSGISTDLSFTLHELGGLNLMLAREMILKELNKLGLARGKRPKITAKGELALANRPKLKKSARIYFNCKIGFVALIPHSICLLSKENYEAGTVPRIMVGNWCQKRRMIEFKPECRFRKNGKMIRIKYGRIMRADIPARLVLKSEWSR